MKFSRSLLCVTLLSTALLISAGCGKSNKKPLVSVNDPRNPNGLAGDAAGRSGGAGSSWNPNGGAPGSDPGAFGSGSSFAGSLGGNGSGAGGILDAGSNGFLNNGNTSGVDAATLVAELEMVHFDYDSSDIKPDWHATLDKNAAWLQSNPSVNVQIEGHCDERGTDEYNISLGQRRADAIREYLIGKGIDGTRLTTISYGKMRPLAFDQNEESHYLNRRGMFLVYSPEAGTQTAATGF
ncbi:MAG: peptidoglycan-associated lipoprotein Pal [Candidatus Sumerlaeia bacterium]|nr:peptidoglycan-associated lipoprotein Pal [Candidatus Sumerlaeia bacterium]